VGEVIEMRPEITYERSFEVKAYGVNNVTGKGGFRNEVTFAGYMTSHY